jgi:diaminopimelate epimerase
MSLQFWKMHGAGNDFILFDDREGGFPIDQREWINDFATRRTGIGSDGVILIQPSETADFRMRFFNPDGKEAEMCGNGARCVARLAHEIGAAPRDMVMETVAGPVKAVADGDQVCLGMTKPRDWIESAELTFDDGSSLQIGFVNTGVPHVVAEIDDLDQLDIQKVGSSIRYHSRFAPAGTNANFIQVIGHNHLRVRTYERGVECETLACGTGMVACALLAAKWGLVQSPVSLTCAGGDILKVEFSLTDHGADEVTLLGPAVHVFTGTLIPPA